MANSRKIVGSSIDNIGAREISWIVFRSNHVDSSVFPIKNDKAVENPRPRPIEIIVVLPEASAANYSVSPRASIQLEV